MLKIGVLASGRGSNLQAIMDNIASGNLKAEITVVISDQEYAYALERARQKDIPAVYINPGDYSSRIDYEKTVLGVLQENRVELVVLAGYMRLVGKEILEAYPNRVMNIHPALIPAFPGTHSQQDAVDYGVRYSGCTVHFVDEGMDSGPIILQAVVPVLQDDTGDILALRILKEEHVLLSQAIQLFSEGRLEVKGRQVRIK